jgi:replicative DNA helicase
MSNQFDELNEKLDNELEKVKQEQSLQEELDIMADYRGKDEVISSHQMLEMMKDEMKNPPVKFFSVNIPTLDKLVDGFREGDLVTISSPTKQGKTTLAQSLTHDFAEKDIPCLWFSWELTKREFMEKFGDTMPFFSLPKNLMGNSVEWVEKKVVESIAKFGTKIVFLDHLHFIVDLKTISQRSGVSLVIGGVMRELKRIALKWNICIFLIAHVTKINFEKESPSLSDIRDSSFIAQESDTVLMIWRKMDKKTKEYSVESVLSVQANRRNGNCGKINIVFDKGRFVELNKATYVEKPIKQVPLE